MDDLGIAIIWALSGICCFAIGSILTRDMLLAEWNLDRKRLRTALSNAADQLDACNRPTDAKIARMVLENK